MFPKEEGRRCGESCCGGGGGDGKEAIHLFPNLTNFLYILIEWLSPLLCFLRMK